MTVASILPLVQLALPLAAGLVLLAAEPGRPRLARLVGGASVLAQLALAVGSILALRNSNALVEAIGTGLRSAGVVLVLDRLAAWMLVVAALGMLVAFGHGCARPARPGRRDQAVLQFQLFALDGIFLVGDLVTLFLFCQALALAARAALVRETGAAHTLAGRRSAAAYLAGAAAFAITIGCVVTQLGTPDLAALAIAAPAVSGAGGGFLFAASFLLLAVLALGALGAPLILWRQSVLARAPAFTLVIGALAVQACVYMIVRLYTLVFPCFIAGPCGPSGLALPFGLTAITAGALAALSVRERRALPACLLVASTGMLLIAVGSFRHDGLAAGIYLLMHAALATSTLFLADDALGSAAAGRNRRLWAIGYGVALAALLSLPPLSGFVGLLALLRASAPDALAVWSLVGAAVLVAGIATARLGALAPPPPAQPAFAPRFASAGVVLGLACLIGLSVAAAPALDIAAGVARQLLDRTVYVEAVGAVRADPAPAGRAAR